VDYFDRNMGQPHRPRKEQPSDISASFDEFRTALGQLAEATSQAQRVLEARCFRFYLAEKEYTSSPIATGVLFEDGTVALRFYTKSRTRALSDTALYHSLKELLFQHGHQGKRHILWIDGPPEGER